RLEVDGRDRRSGRLRRRLLLRQRQPQGERAPEAGRALDLERTAVERRELAREREADPGTEAVGGGGGLVEAVEDAFEVAGRDAGAGVADADDRVRAVLLQPEMDLAALRGEPERVGEEVADDLLDDLRVAGEHERRGRAHVERDALRLGEAGEGTGERAEERGEVLALRAERPLARVKPGEVEELVDEAEEAVGLGPHPDEEGALALRPGLLDEPVDRPEDEGQRRPELVGEVREEARLR